MPQLLNLEPRIIDADEAISDDKKNQTTIDSRARLVDAEKRFHTAPKEIGLLGKNLVDHPDNHARELDRP